MYDKTEHDTKAHSNLVSKVGVLLVCQIREGVGVRDSLIPLDLALEVLGAHGLLANSALNNGFAALYPVAPYEEDTHYCEDDVEEDVETEVGGEAVLVARGIAILEDLHRFLDL